MYKKLLFLFGVLFWCNMGVARIDNAEASPWRLGVNIGYSGRTASMKGDLTSQQKSYIESGKQGIAFGGDVAYFFKNDIGIGLVYSQFRSSSSVGSMSEKYSADTTIFYSSMSDQYSITFIGPIFAIRKLSKNGKHAFLLNFGLGYLGYVDDGKAMLNYYTVRNTNNTVSTYAFSQPKITATQEGNTLGTLFLLGYDFKITSHVAIGLQLSVVRGSLSKIEQIVGGKSTTISLDSENREDLSRLDCSVGLRFFK